jgi:hypothetical protein
VCVDDAVGVLLEQRLQLVRGQVSAFVDQLQ